MTTRRLISISTLLTLVLSLGLTSEGWSQDQTNKKKRKRKQQTSSESSTSSSNQVVKKAEKQLLNYKTDAAKTTLEPVLQTDDPAVEAALGKVLIQEQKYAEAVTKLQAAAQRSKDLSVFIDLGDAQAYARNSGAADGAWRQAAQKSEALLANKPGNVDGLFVLGTAQQRLKQYDPAVQNLSKAREAKPRDERIAFELGLTHMLRNEHQAAFDQLSGAIEINSGYAYAYYYRALAADKIGRKDILVNDLDRFVFLAPTAPEAEKAKRILASARG